MFADDLREISKKHNFEIENNAVLDDLKKEWELKIGNYIDLSYNNIKKDLELKVKQGCVTKCGIFSSNTIVETTYNWGGEYFTSVTNHLLRELCENNEKYSNALNFLMQRKHHRKYLAFINTFTDHNIGMKLVEKCKNDGIIASYTWEEDSEFCYTKFTLTAKIKL